MARPAFFTAAIFSMLSLASAAQADGPLNIKFTFRVDVENGDSALYKNLAPWYTYFPYDPHANAPQATHFPAWPSTWPPAPPKKDATGGSTPMGAMNYDPRRAMTGWQPVSYSYAVPYYWYGR